MPTPMETLLQSLVPNRTPPGGVVRSVGAMPAIAPQAVAPAAAPAAPQLSPTAKYIQDMQALMSGGIGPLSTGQKIAAFGQVLQAAGSRGASDPAAVLQNVRKQQMDKLNAQYQIAQLQQSQQREAQKRAFISQYASTVPEDKRGLLENADIDKAFDIVEKELTGKKQLFQIVNGPSGNKVAVFSDYSRVETDFPNNLETDLVDRGSQKLLINKDNGEVIKVYDKDLSPSVIARRRNPYSPPKPAGRATDSKKPAKKTTAAVVAPDLLAAITKRLNQVN